MPHHVAMLSFSHEGCEASEGSKNDREVEESLGQSWHGRSGCVEIDDEH